MNNIDYKTKISDLTVEEFLVVINGEYSPTKKKQYVYGLKGLARLLGCSRSKAASLKSSGIIDDAIVTTGRLIIIDSEKVMELLKQEK